jgi:hypothetical protein
MAVFPSFAVKNGMLNVTLGGVFKYHENYPTKYIRADGWANTWADDDKIYVTQCDSFGWNNAAPSSNFSISTISDYSTSTTGTSVNKMTEFGTATAAGSDGHNYKSGGLWSVNGVLYAAVIRTHYGDVSSDYLQTLSGVQFIKSTDHGLNWTPLPPSTNEPYVAPMWSGSEVNRCPGGIIQYGKDYSDGANSVHNSDLYVYGTGADTGWNNGSNIYLSRCLIENLGNLSASDWSYYKGNGATGMDSNNWGAMADATPIITKTRKLGPTSINYLPALQRYVFFNWYYPSTVPVSAVVSNNTIWELYESPTPWGPWQTNGRTITWNPSGRYNGNIITKSVEVDGGRNVVIATAGDYLTSGFASSGYYTLTLIPAALNS